MLIKQRHLRTVSRRFWGIFFGIIIGLAVLIQIGRQAFPLVNDYKHIISAAMGEQLGVVVSVGEISAEWRGLRPKVILNEVIVQSHAGQEIFFIENTAAELSLLDSLVQRGLAWRTIIFSGFRTTFIQNDNFSWGIKGYDGGTANTENPFLFDDPLDVFLFGRRVNIESASLNFEFNSGKRTELNIPSINLENDRFFHRMTALINIEEQESLRFVIEGYGDPRNKERFSASGYLGLKDIPTTDIYNALFNKETDDLQLPSLNSADQVSNIEFWFKGSPKTGMTATGSLSVKGIPSTFESHLDLPEQLSADITGGWKHGSGWFLTLQDLDVLWGDNHLPIKNLNFYGQGREVGLRLPELNVSSLIDTAIAANKVEDKSPKETKARQFINALKPQGMLRNIDVSLRSKEEGYFLAKMNIERAGIEAFKGIPGFRNIDGYAELSLLGGYLDVDSEEFEMNLEQVFEVPVELDETLGQIAWRLEKANKIAYFQSSQISAKHGESNILGSFAMSLPFNRSIGESQMHLLLEVDETRLDVGKSFLPKNVPSSLKAWLSSALIGGDVDNLAIFYSGSINSEPSFKPVYQIAGDVGELTLKYNEDWPPISELTGRLFLDSGAFSVDLSSAKVDDINISKATVSLDRLGTKLSPDILISAHMHGETRDAQKFLIESPISESFTDFLSQWTFKGRFRSELNLSVPVEFSEEKMDYKVSTSLENNIAFMQSLDLNFEQVSGDFVYSKSGLAQSDELSLVLWDRPISARVMSDIDSQEVKLEFESTANVEAMKDWLARPELFALKNDFDLTGQIIVPTQVDSERQGPLIELNSTLAGVPLELPSPLGKSAIDVGEYSLSIQFSDAGLDYLYKHNHMALVDMHITSNAAPAIAIYVGPEAPALIKSEGEINIAGNIDHADFDQWLTAYTQYVAELDRQLQKQQLDAFDSETANADASVITMGVIDIESFSFGETSFPELNLSLAGDDQKWVFSMLSPRAVGQVTVPSDQSPISLDFQRLGIYPHDFDPDAVAANDAVEQPDSDELAESVFAEVDLTKFVEMDVNIDALDILGDDWGKWRFLLVPIENGIHLNNLVADFKQLRVGKASPSQFYWTRTEGQNVSHFTGPVAVTNVADALEAWDQDGIVTSKQAEFNIRAHWLAEPDLVSLAKLNGDVDLVLQDGSFVRATAAGENPFLRLIALFNFDTLARRLRLDFSDLAARGFAYDEVSASVKFNNGIATLDEPVIVNSSSSRMQMAGQVDLVEEAVDAELVVTLPVASNIAVATAFLVGVPAGVGVYLVSKMLGKTVDKASSINYSVNGSWDDPKIKVRKIFDDGAALRKGEELKEQRAAQNAEIEKAGAGRDGGEEELPDSDQTDAVQSLETREAVNDPEG